MEKQKTSSKRKAAIKVIVAADSYNDRHIVRSRKFCAQQKKRAGIKR
jgi:ATP-dependent Clp protease adapter protein ClpS